MDIKIFSNNLKNLRVERKLSRAELGKMCQTTHTSIGRWENGESIPDVDKAFLLAKALGISIFALIGHDDICKIDNIKPTVAQALEVLGLELKNRHPLHEKVDEFLSLSPHEIVVNSIIQSINAAIEATEISRKKPEKKEMI